MELGGTGEELRDWTDIRDVVRVLELAMSFPFNPDAMPIVNAGSEQATSVSRIAELFWNPGPFQPGSCSTASRGPGDPFSLVADGTLLQNDGF